MKNQRRTEIRVGITVLVGIIVFLWILGWAKNFSLTPTDNTVKVQFTNTAGLEVGDPVTVNGVRKGFVEDIATKGVNVVVKMKISNDIALKEDAAFAVSMLDLMGGKKVEVNPGLSNNLLDYNQVQTGTFYADVPYVMSMVGSFQKDISSTILDLKITLTSLNNYLGDKKLNNDIKSSMSNLSEVTKKLNILIDENRNNLKQLTANTVELTEDAKNFFDQNKEKWFYYQDHKWIPIPYLPKEIFRRYKDFTGIGTRTLNEAGKSAIHEIIYNYKESLNEKDELSRS